jgi:hypothetical protein
MGAPITPQVQINADFDNQYLFGEDNRGRKKWYKSFPYKTYRKLKADLKRLMEEYHTKEVTVFRSRRGEWGEWFETWRLEDGKLHIEKEGWM